ncbi:hypothetical protein Tco_0231851 [Tanacetum coccineum]
MKGHSRTFMSLLAKACNGTDKSMGLPYDKEFWTKFAEKLRSESNMQEKDLTAKSYEVYGKRLQHLYYALQVVLKDEHDIDPNDQNSILEHLTTCLIEKCTGIDSRNSKAMLPLVRVKPFFLVVTSGNSSVSETQQSRIFSLKRSNINVVSSKVTSQSSGSHLLPEVEMELQEALHDLVRRKMLTLKDVVVTESYLSTSTWASSIFLQQKDLGERSTMIINAGHNAEEKNIRKM